MKTNYEVINSDWEDIKKYARNIIDQMADKNIEIDTLVPILRGGMPLAMMLGTNIDGVKTSSIHIRRSLNNEINAEFGEAKVVGVSNIEEITGKRILLTEDTVDYGYTLDLALEYIKKYNPKEVHIATLVNFNRDKYKDILCGKYYDEQKWIVFPWEEKVYAKKS